MGSLNTGSVGSCMFSQCSPRRGPTTCSMGTCWCAKGYCRYPASTVHVQSRYCVARIPHATCHLSRFCWTGGLTRSFCESGLCMCKFGFKPQLKIKKGKEAQWRDKNSWTYDCVPTTSELAEAVASNATKEEITSLIEQQNHSNSMAARNLV